MTKRNEPDRELRIGPTDPDQLSCLPFDSPGNLENHLAQIVTTVQRLAPDLNGHECVSLLAELALVHQCLDRIEGGIRWRVSQAADRMGFLRARAQ